MPRSPKLSAGYFAAPEMDPIDLWIGSEGTLGIVTEATLQLLGARPPMCLAFVPFGNRRRGAGRSSRELRRTAHATWAAADPRGIDVSAIEHMDARCLQLLREDGADRANGVTWLDGTAIALLVTLELPAGDDIRRRLRRYRPRAQRRTRPTPQSSASAGCSMRRASWTTSRSPFPATARGGAAPGAQRSRSGRGEPAGRTRETIDRCTD